MTEDLWGPVEVARWASVPVTLARLATEADVREGRAVFYLEGAQPPDAEPLPISLPALAFLWETERRASRVVVAIQAERSFDRRLVGIRFFEGGNGICTLDELEWIDASTPSSPDSRKCAATRTPAN